MFNFIKSLLATTEDKYIALLCGTYGWFGGIKLSVMWIGWDGLLKGFMGLTGSAITVLVGLLVKDFYTLKIKKKIFKTDKTDDKERDNERAA